MKKNKSIIAVLSAATLLLSFVACSLIQRLKIINRQAELRPVRKVKLIKKIKIIRKLTQVLKLKLIKKIKIILEPIQVHKLTQKLNQILIQKTVLKILVL